MGPLVNGEINPWNLYTKAFVHEDEGILKGGRYLSNRGNQWRHLKKKFEEDSMQSLQR